MYQGSMSYLIIVVGVLGCRLHTGCLSMLSSDFTYDWNIHLLSIFFPTHLGRLERNEG